MRAVGAWLDRAGQSGLGDERVRRFVDDPVERLAIDRFAADLEQQRHRQRRHPRQGAMADAALDTPQHHAQPAHVGKPGRRLRHGRAQQHVIGLEPAQHVIDQVGVERHLTAGLPAAA